MGLAYFDGASVAGRQQLIFAEASPVPYWADGMNHMPRRQPITPGDFRVAGFTAVQGAAFSQQLGTSRAMDRAIDATAAK